jgi:glycosyltransferase involved in cell wall biosynthesis
MGWIPDFQHRHLPEFFPPQQCIARDKRFATLASEASAVVLSSATSRDDLLRWYEVDVERVRVLRFRSMAAPEWYQGDPRAVARSLGLPDRFLIFPSQFWAHKNHRVLFKSLAILAARGLDVHLACTGAPGDFRNDGHFDRLKSLISELGVEDRIHILGLLPRLEQIQLMRAATAVVQPSLFEGWSALLEDARTLGKRVFVSDIAVHREQEPAAARFFPPNDPEALADLLAEDWAEMASGPDVATEIRAYEEHLELGRNYGDELIEAMDTAHTAWSNRRR